jgi:transposase
VWECSYGTNFSVYPTHAQQQALARAFGCARVVFNDGLRARQTARDNGERYISDGDLSKRVITEAKRTPERAWLGEVSAVVLQQAPADLNVAYRNFSASIAGRRRGRRIGPPRFRSRKDSRQAIRFTVSARFRVLDNGRLRLPKVGDVEVRWSRALPAAPGSVTVIRDAARNVLAQGRWESLNACGAQVRPAPVPAPRWEAGIRSGAARCTARSAAGISVPEVERTSNVLQAVASVSSAGRC